MRNTTRNATHSNKQHEHSNRPTRACTLQPETQLTTHETQHNALHLTRRSPTRNTTHSKHKTTHNTSHHTTQRPPHSPPRHAEHKRTYTHAHTDTHPNPEQSNTATHFIHSARGTQSSCNTSSRPRATQDNLWAGKCLLGVFFSPFSLSLCFLLPRIPEKRKRKCV